MATNSVLYLKRHFIQCHSLHLFGAETLTQIFYSYHNIQFIVLSIISQSIDACHSSLRCSTGLLPAASLLCTITARKEVNRHTKPAISTNGHHCMR